MLSGKTILAFVGTDYEDLELWYHKLRFIEAGASFVTAGPEAGKTYTGKNGYPCKSDIAIDGIDTSTYDGLLCGGGWMPDKLRRDPEVLRITQEFAAAGKWLPQSVMAAGFLFLPMCIAVLESPGLPASKMT